MGYIYRPMLQSCLGASVLPLYFLAPGYVAASLSNLFRFRSLPLLSRLLWALVLSPALSILWSVHPYLNVSPRATNVGFILFGVAGLLCFVRDQRSNTTEPIWWDWYTRWCAVGLVLLGLYCVLAPLGVEIGGRLYENAASQTDWSIRIQLINACLRDGSHPASPMYAFHGEPAPLHTYFYWYVLCAQIARLTGIGAQPALIASCVGAAFAQVAVLLLLLQVLRISPSPMRRQAAMLPLAMCVTGLDVLVVVFDLFRHRFRPDPQLAFSDHAPGFLYADVWSPHHVAGAVLCLAGLLLVMTAKDLARRQILVHAVLAACCYAAAAGTSTFVTIIFLTVCSFVLVEAVLRKDWRVVETIVIAGVLALLLTFPYFKAMSRSSSGAPANAGSPVHVRLRYDDQTLHIAQHFYFDRHQGKSKRSKVVFELMRLGLICFFLAVDLGLILFVAWDRFRQDWPRRASLRSAERLLWIIFLTAAVPCFLLTSSNGTHFANDAGFHAATVMRIVAVLWAVPMLIRYADTPPPRSAWQRFGAVLLGIGLLSQAAQLFANRFQMLLVDRGWVPALPVGERVPEIGRRFAQIRAAMDAAAQYTPPNAIVEVDPHSRLASALLMYTHRQMAASDEGCNLPFGGSEVNCFHMVRQFNELFGGTPHYQGEQALQPRAVFDPKKTDVAAFDQVCRENHLSAIVADYTSPAWQHPNTWVWTQSPTYANSTARVFLCPNPGKSRSSSP